MGTTFHVDDNGNVSKGGGEGIAALFLVVLLAPPFFLPGYFAYLLCQPAFAYGLHPMFRLLAVVAAFTLVFWGIWRLLRWLHAVLPRAIFTILAMVYVGLCYGYVGRGSWHLDDVWSSGLAALSALIIYGIVSFFFYTRHESLVQKAKTVVGANLILLSVFWLTVDSWMDFGWLFDNSVRMLMNYLFRF